MAESNNKKRKLIKAVNKKLNSFGNIYRYCESKESFIDIDGYLLNVLFQAMCDLHPKLRAKRIFSMYWYRDYKGDGYFSLPRERAAMRSSCSC